MTERRRGPEGTYTQVVQENLVSGRKISSTMCRILHLLCLSDDQPVHFLTEAHKTSCRSVSEARYRQYNSQRLTSKITWLLHPLQLMRQTM